MLREEAVNEAGAGDTITARLSSLGIGPEFLVRAERIVRRARRAQDPANDDDIWQLDNEAFTEFSQVAPILENALANRVVMRGEIVARRTARVTIAFVVVVGVIVGAYFALRQPLAVASAVFPGEGSFGSEKAVDGDPATELAAPRCHAGVARRAAVAAAFDSASCA